MVFKKCLPSLFQLSRKLVDWRAGVLVLIWLMKTRSPGDWLAYPPSLGWQSPEKSWDVSGSQTQNPVLYPLCSSCFAYNDNSKRIKSAETVSTRFNIWLKVLHCVDKVHLKKMRKSLKVVQSSILYSIN